MDAAATGNRPRAVARGAATRPARSSTEPAAPPPRPEAGKTAIVSDMLRKARPSRAPARRCPARRVVAGKTGTTENYADAWFVGYCRDLAVAVWVGYPNEPIPMLTEYKGKPVAGGTYPAEIWKSFMQLALPYLDRSRRRSIPPSSPARRAKLVVDP